MRTIKKASVVTLSCLFFLTGCAEETNLAGQKTVIQESEEISKIGNRESENTTEITNLDDLIIKSDNIVIGDVVEEEQFSGMDTYKYTVSVNNELKGKVETKSIDVYEAYGVLEKGKKYFLFLEYWENELYPNPVFTSISENSLIEIDQNALIGEEEIVGLQTMNEMINYIRNSPQVNLFSVEDNDVREKANNLEELISLSDNILRIVPKVVIHENKYVKTVEIEILQRYKGTISPDKLVLNLPANIILEKEYIVFLQGDEGYRLATKQGSVVSKDEESQWQDILKEVSK